MMNAGMGIGKGAASRGLALALALTGPLYANTELNDYVSCTAQGVVRLNETDFHVDPSDEPMDVYFAGVNGWTLVLPPNGHAILSEAPSAVVKWATRKPEGRMSGKVEHCRFPFVNTDLGHRTSPAVFLPETSPIQVSVVGNGISVSGVLTSTTTPGIHKIRREYSPCQCGKFPFVFREEVDQAMPPVLFDYKVTVVVAVQEGPPQQFVIPKPHVGRTVSVGGSFFPSQPFQAEGITVHISVRAYRTDCEQCVASAGKTFYGLAI